MTFQAFHLYKYESWTDIDASRAALKVDGEYKQVYKATLPAMSEQFRAGDAYKGSWWQDYCG